MKLSGLTIKQVKELQSRYGRNEISSKNKGNLRKKIIKILSEPIYLLLSISAIIYFILGEPADGAIMIGFVLFVIGIDVLQDARTGNTLKKLKEISTPKITVIREGNEVMISGTELVPGDVMLISEGVKIPADGALISSVGLCIDESILTGESEGVWKQAVNKGKPQSEEGKEYFRKDYCYTGTLVILGRGTVIVEKIGNATEYGKIADKIAKAPVEITLLQKQLKKLAKQCTYFAAILFILVGFVTFFNLSEFPLNKRWTESLLAGVVLALSMIPGEFPVIQSVFLSMGALRLAKQKALIRRLPAVETLGAVSVLCLDKTGTITQNKMTVQEFWTPDQQEDLFCRTISMACKAGTYDPMEKAMLEYGERLCSKCRRKTERALLACNITNNNSVLVKDYAFTNERKAMGQVWQEAGNFIIAAKGSPETILSLCLLPKEQESLINSKISELSQKGLRVIAMADRMLSDQEAVPDSLPECQLYFRGIIGLLDPPRENMPENIQACYKAGIRVIIITGDHPVTAATIAGKIGIDIGRQVITGDEISRLTEEELRQTVKECNLFARVLPLHKMRIVKALKDNGEIVAMTGDGVNDSPAQRIADIGIAMGKHGSEVCREAADLILLDDNFSTIIASVRDGRRIYQNIGKAIEYVLAIHIPIALISLIAPILGIGPKELLLLPLHIVLLELIMDPTCSVVLERQPAEDNIMSQKPRNPSERLLSFPLFKKSVIQGFVIFIAAFSVYFGLLTSNHSPELARTAGFTVLVLSNIFLVLVNSSEYESVIRTLIKIRRDKGIWLVNIITLFGLWLMIYSPFHHFLELTALPILIFVAVAGISAASVFWYELIKLLKRRKMKVKY